MGKGKLSIENSLENVNNIDKFIEYSQNRDKNFADYSELYFAKDLDSGFWLNNFEDAEIFHSKYSTEKPFALDVTKEEFVEHYKNIETLLDSHYRFGKENMPGFPDSKCSISSLNVFFSSHKMGYHNSIEVIKDEENPNLSHCYNAFMFKVDGQDLVLWADPTSGQLFRSREVDNLIFLTGKDRQEYKTHWNFEKDLYPDTYRGLNNIGKVQSNMQEMMDYAFENSKKIDKSEFTFLESEEKEEALSDQLCEFQFY